MKMKIIIRVDASSTIGTGHVMRCLTLAEEIRSRECQVSFICRAHPGHMADMIARQGFQVSLLPEPAHAFQASADQKDYAAWLGVPQEDDAKQTIDALGFETPDWLIVDHYGLDCTWEKELRPYARNIMVIDDLANRLHDCDLLLNQNFSLEEICNGKTNKDSKEGSQGQGLVPGNSRYTGLVPDNCRLLLGPRYALLHPDYSQYRQTMKPRTGQIKRVLVFMGGSDNANLTGMALEALSEQALAHLEADVVIGANNPLKDKIVKQVENRANTHLHTSRPHLADLMAEADLAVGAGGVTTWERMCLGLPSIVVSLAENQKSACEGLSKVDLIHYLGFWSDVTASDIANKVISLVNDHYNLCSQTIFSNQLVDGLGVKRIGKRIIS
jgi:spore coat polysaccharide biosynthesis predicted glycosyltransferase SpsG